MTFRSGGKERERTGGSTAPIGRPALFGDRATRRGAGVWAFLLAIVTAGALVHVGVRIRGLQVGYDLGSERRIAGELEEQRRRLQIEIGMLKDPGRVISIAREKLNMGPPAPEAILRLGPAAPSGGALTATVGAASPGGVALGAKAVQPRPTTAQARPTTPAASGRGGR